MTTIYSSAALKTRQREVKDAARSGVVHITENGNGAFVLMSEEIFQRQLDEAAERAAYAERMRTTINRGRADIAGGHFVEGLDDFIASMNERTQTDG